MRPLTFATSFGRAYRTLPTKPQVEGRRLARTASSLLSPPVAQESHDGNTCRPEAEDHRNDEAPVVRARPGCESATEELSGQGAYVGRARAEARCVPIHYAQGHGRSATFAAAIPVQLGLASVAEQALSVIHVARPLAKLLREQKAALIQYLSGVRMQSASFSQGQDIPPPFPGR